MPGYRDISQVVLRNHKINYMGFCLKAQSLSKIDSCYFFQSFILNIQLKLDKLKKIIISPSSQV